MTNEQEKSKWLNLKSNMDLRTPALCNLDFITKLSNTDWIELIDFIFNKVKVGREQMIEDERERILNKLSKGKQYHPDALIKITYCGLKELMKK